MCGLLCAPCARAATPPPNPVIPAIWQADAICETGRNPPIWDYGKRGRAGYGGSYEGGIAFAASTWHAWHRFVPAARRYDHAYDAPADVQWRVAQYGLDHYGRWGCLFHTSVWRLHRP